MLQTSISSIKEVTEEITMENRIMPVYKSKTILILILLCLFCALPEAKGQSADSSRAETLTLEQAIRLALSENRQIKNAGLDIGKAEETIAATRTRRLPSLDFEIAASQQLKPIDFTFERGVFGTFPATGPIPEENTTIGTPLKPTAIITAQVSQPLSQLYRINLNLKQLKLEREVAQEELRSKQHEIISQVKSAYFGILQTQSALRSASETIKLYQEMDRVTGEYVAQQVALKTDSLDVRTKLAKAEYDAITLIDQLTVQKQQLNMLLGRDILTEFNVSSAPEAENFEADLVAARTKALESRPEVREARLKVRQAEGERRIKKSEFIPDVSLAFQYVSLRNFSSFLPQNYMNVGISVSWEIFDWGRKKHELAEKDMTIEQARNGVREAESATLIEVNEKFSKLRQSRQLLRIAGLTQESAIENVRVMTNRYKLQVSLRKDVLQAQAGLEQANYQYQQALVSFLVARAEFEKAIGEDK